MTREHEDGNVRLMRKTISLGGLAGITSPALLPDDLGETGLSRMQVLRGYLGDYKVR